MMHVLITSPRLPPAASGTASYTKMVAEGLAGRGHQVTVVTHRGKGAALPACQVVSGGRFQDVFVRMATRLGLGQTARRLTASLVVHRACRRARPDVVECPDATAEILLLRFLRPRPGLVLQLHGPLSVFDRYDPPSGARAALDHKLAKALDRLGARSAGVVCAPSHQLRELLSLDGWRFGDEVYVAPLPSPAPSPQPPEERSDLVVSALRPQAIKGVDLLADAVAQISRRRPGTTFEIYGVASVDELARHASAPDALREFAPKGTLRCMGVVPQTAVRASLHCARLALVTSRFDSWPIFTMEACAEGTPSVVTTGTGSASVLSEAGAALVATPDPGAIADACVELLEDDSKRETMGANATRAAETRFGLERFLDHRAFLYERALKARGTRLERGDP